MKRTRENAKTQGSLSLLTLLLVTSTLFASNGSEDGYKLTRPSIKASTVQPYHPQTGIDITTRVFDDLSHLNVKFVRIEFIYEWDESSSINFPAYDYIVDEFAKRDIKVLGLIDYASLKHDGTDSWETDAFRQDFVDQTKTIVSHYAQRQNPIEHWEIWNEQDIQEPTFDCRIEPEFYAPILVECYDAIKQIDPNSIVLMGGISPKGFEYEENYLDNLYNSEAVQLYYKENQKYPFDLVACHPYPETFSDPDPGGEKNSLAKVMNERIKAVMNKHHDSEKKVWITELGWNSAHNSEAFQKKALEESFKVLDTLVDPEHPELGPYVDNYTWFKYDSWHPKEEWGLVNRHRSRLKPAYLAFESLTDSKGERPPLAPEEKGHSAPIIGSDSDIVLPEQVLHEDLIMGKIPEVITGNLAEGSLGMLTNGSFDKGTAGVQLKDGQYEKPLHLKYKFEKPVDLDEIRIFAAHFSEGGSRAFQSHKILLNGVEVKEDLRTGNYGQVRTGDRLSAVSLVQFNPSSAQGQNVTSLEIISYATTSWNGDFRDRWSPVDNQEKDVDGGGPACMGPRLREIDVIGSPSSSH
jgi:Cellulase (glycosyl hydrolase family 5)